MSRRAVFVLCSVLILSAQTATAAECKVVGVAELSKLRAQSAALPGAMVTNFKIVTRITHESDAVVDFFTRPKHKAHPALVRRSVVAEGGDFTIKTEGFTAGNAALCERWMNAFLREDAAIEARLPDSAR